MLFAKVLLPVTMRLDADNGLLLFVMDGLVPLMLSEPTVNAICKSSVALLDPVVLLMVSALVIAPKLLVLSTFKIPKLMVVPPVYVLVPDNVQVPVPDLVKLEVPEVAGLAKIGVSVAAPVPVKVKVGELVSVVAIVPALLKVNAPLPPEASIVPPLLPMVNNRSVDTSPPVYFNVPPLITKLVAAFDDLPMLLLDKPLAKVDTLKVPAFIVVIPV